MEVLFEKKTTAVLALIVAFAFGSRLYLALSTPFIYDEYQWASLADTVDLRPAHFRLPLHGDQHPPAQVYWAAVGTAVFGKNLLGYRSLSVVFGTAAVLLMYFIGKQLAGPVAGLLAAFLLATNEYHIGISRLCTEKNYLTFAVLGLLLFDRTLKAPSTPRFLALGTAMGIGALTKQSLILWIPVFGWEMFRRPGGRTLWRQSGPWYGLAALVVLLSPDILWNVALGSEHVPGSVPNSDAGLAYQISRLSLGTWSWAPLALFLPPLYFHFIEQAISEYAVMTPIIGAGILLATVSSLYFLHSTQARFFQVLGLGTLLFFCLFTSPRGEFWWADAALIPLLVLTAGVLANLRGAWRLLIPPALGVMLVCSLKLVMTKENYYPIQWGAPTPELVETHKRSQMELPLSFRGRDHLALCSVAGHRLPPCGYYYASLDAYHRYLTAAAGNPNVRGVAPASGWPEISAETVADERLWVESQLQRFSNSGVKRWDEWKRQKVGGVTENVQADGQYKDGSSPT